MKIKIIIFFLAGWLALVSLNTPGLVPFTIPKGWPKPAYDFKKNPLSENKIALGRILFYDPILSKDSTISCNSCHSQYSAFTHIDHNLSHGIAGRIGTRNSPALLNLAWGKNYMWDGSVRQLDAQALSPITNPLEMDEDIDHVVKKLQATNGYSTLFYKAFGDSSITGERILKSLSQFMLTLVSANSKYDRVKRGEDTFTTSETNGYAVYKKNCSSCHTEPLFTNNQFENNGLYINPDLNDHGRVKISHNPLDSFKFKVPSLRNVEYSYPYMHDGRFKTLGLVINNYLRGIQESKTLSPELRKGMYFSTDDKADLIQFLFTLTDKDFLHNPNFAEPQKK